MSCGCVSVWVLSSLSPFRISHLPFPLNPFLPFFLPTEAAHAKIRTAHEQRVKRETAKADRIARERAAIAKAGGNPEEVCARVRDDDDDVRVCVRVWLCVCESSVGDCNKFASSFAG